MKTGIKKPEKKNVQNKIWERVEKTAGNIQNTEVLQYLGKYEIFKMRKMHTEMY